LSQHCCVKLCGCTRTAACTCQCRGCKPIKCTCGVGNVTGVDHDADCPITKSEIAVPQSEPRFLKEFDGMPRMELEHRLASVIAENALLNTTLTIVQTRCTEQLLELRKYRESSALPGLGWDCTACGAFNGSQKEELIRCRCCDAERATNSSTTRKEREPTLGKGTFKILSIANGDET
jgi:hypothetical protein